MKTKPSKERVRKLKKKFEKDLTDGIDANHCGGMMLVGKTWKWVLNERQKTIGQMIEEIKKWMDFHQDEQATFSTDSLISHLMKEFL